MTEIYVSDIGKGDIDGQAQAFKSVDTLFPGGQFEQVTAFITGYKTNGKIPVVGLQSGHYQANA